MSIYLDNNATTPLAPEALDAMLPYLREQYGNASSLHHMGAAARRALDHAREQVAALIGASPSEVVFTSGGTESNNTAIRTALARDPQRHRILISAVEHPAVLRPCELLEKEGRAEIVRVPVDGTGRLDPDAVAAELDERTALVSVMAANNETGVLLPYRKIAALCAERKIPYHCDAVQIPGKLPLNLREPGAAFASLSAHKFHGPKGVGVLYVRRAMRFSPQVLGGSQERRRRAGTENVAGIVGMGVAAELAAQRLDDRERVQTLRDRLEAGIVAGCPGATVNGADAERLPNTLNVSFRRIEAEPVLISLDREGICVSSGSACSSGSSEPSHVLRAMGVGADHVRGSIRFSLSHLTTDAEIDRTLEVLPRTIQKLARLTAG